MTGLEDVGTNRNAGCFLWISGNTFFFFFIVRMSNCNIACFFSLVMFRSWLDVVLDSLPKADVIWAGGLNQVTCLPNPAILQFWNSVIHSALFLGIIVTQSTLFNYLIGLHQSLYLQYHTESRCLWIWVQKTLAPYTDFSDCCHTRHTHVFFCTYFTRYSALLWGLWSCARLHSIVTERTEACSLHKIKS